MDALTLRHMNDDRPECSIVFGGGRLGDDDLTDYRRIEVQFSDCYFARVNVKDDNEDIDASGFEVLGRFSGPIEEYLDWRHHRWRATGLCPDPRFYVATQSSWLASVTAKFGLAHLSLRHFLVAGRDNYVEVLASGFSWREWLWSTGPRDQCPDANEVVGSGAGVD